VIDCEWHALVPSLETVVPYVDEAMGLRMLESEFVLPPAGPHPGVEIEGAPIDEAYFDPARVSQSIPASVEEVILVPSQSMTTSGWLDHELAATFVSAVNSFLIDVWLPADPRFRLAIGLSPHDGATSAREVERHAGNERVVAACMPLVAVNMGHPHYYPIYEALSSAGMPLIVHPAGSEGTVIGAAAIGGAGPRTPEETYALLPQVAAVNLASLIFDGVFDLHPNLRVVFAGFGFEWAPMYVWRAVQEWRGLRVAVPWVTRSPWDTLAASVRFVVDASSARHDPRASTIAAMLPESVLVYGSDGPYAADDPTEVLEGVPTALRERILRANAIETFTR
jgi:predicted TIM-barrel fold metal-dependent hydrolase